MTAPNKIKTSYEASNKLVCSCNQTWNLKCGSACIWVDCFILVLYDLPEGSKEKVCLCVCAASKINKSSRWNSYNVTYLRDSRRWILLLCKPVPVQKDGFFFFALVHGCEYKCVITDPVWKSPREECRTTTHRSGWYTNYGKCFLVPSTSGAGMSEWQKKTESDFISQLG